LDHVFWGTLFLTLGAMSIVSAGHALIFKRDPRSALGWIVISLTLPFLGPSLYWMIGVNRISRRARQWLETGKRLAGWDTSSFRDLPITADALPSKAFHLLELRALADRIVSAPLMAGNRFTPLHNGDAAYPKMLAEIAGAKNSINLSTYIFDGDAAGRLFTNALREAADRGVEVRVIIDALGEKYSHSRARTQLKGSKVKVARFLPLRQGVYLNLRNHRKILVVDGKTAFTGGMNIRGRHMVKEHNSRHAVADLHFQVEGPVVAELQRVFLEDWYFVNGELLAERRFFPPLTPIGNALSRGIADGPDKEFMKLHWIIMGALACARRSVMIMTPYFIPDRAMISALVTAALRGGEVILILPGRNNLPYLHWATRAYLWELLHHGIRVFYQPPPFVHTKLFLVDGIWSLIGSANLDPRSLRLNFEFNMEVYDAELTAHLEAHCREAIANSLPVTIDEVDYRPLWQKLRDSSAKLFSPYL